MKDWKEKKLEKARSENSKVIQHFGYAVFSVVILILIVVFLHPFYFFSPKFVNRGDEFLLGRNYNSAQLQYEKALIINPWDAKAKSRIELVEKARTNVLALTDFFEQKKASSELEKIELATSVPENETEALKISKQFVEKGDFQLALLPAKTALEMDPDYKIAQEYVRIIEEQL